MIKTLILLAAILPFLFDIQLGFAQSGDELKALQKEIEALKEGQERIQKELEAIKNFLRGRRAPPPFQPVVLRVDGDPVKGDTNAKLTLIDFSDYQ